MEIDIRWGMESTIRWNGPGWYAGRTFPAICGGEEVWEAEMVAEAEATQEEAGIAARLNGYGTPFYLRKSDSELTKWRIGYQDDSCDHCGRLICGGEDAWVDEATGETYCSKRCARAIL